MKRLAELVKLFTEKIGISHAVVDSDPSPVGEFFRADDILFESPPSKGVTEILREFKEQANKYDVKVKIETKVELKHQVNTIEKTEKNSCFVAAVNDQRKAAIAEATARRKASEERIKEARIRISQISDETNSHRVLKSIIGKDQLSPEHALSATSLVNALSKGGTLGNKDTVELNLSTSVSKPNRPKHS